MKALVRSSTLDESVGMVGMYWKDGSRKAEADGVDSGIIDISLLPDLAIDSAGCVEVGANDELVSNTLWYG